MRRSRSTITRRRPDRAISRHAIVAASTRCVLRASRAARARSRHEHFAWSARDASRSRVRDRGGPSLRASDLPRSPNSWRSVHAANRLGARSTRRAGSRREPRAPGSRPRARQSPIDGAIRARTRAIARAEIGARAARTARARCGGSSVAVIASASRPSGGWAAAAAAEEERRHLARARRDRESIRREHRAACTRRARPSRSGSDRAGSRTARANRFISTM